MNFLDTWQELEELYQADFKNGPEDKYYHFFYDISDLINSLSIERIYSNKNLRAAQLDVYERDKAYICTTKGEEGKERAVFKFKRPIGISFKDLPQLCNRCGYSFTEENPYSQFLAKTQYSYAKRGTRGVTATDKDELVSAFRDFRILAIGELDGEYAGQYFISGGQGRNLVNHWYSKLFDNKQLYETLRNWFLANMNSTDGSSQPKMYYHFKNSDIGDATETFTEKPINTTGQLNKKYKPWIDPPKKGDKNPEITHRQAMDFTLKYDVNGGRFKEILGIGPFLVQDLTGKTLLQMNLCQAGPGGYPAPLIFSASGTTGTFETDDNTIVTATRSVKSKTRDEASLQKHLMLNQQTAKELADLYNESEYRVYMPGRRDFTFKAEDIASIILPKAISFDSNSVVLNIEALIEVINSGTCQFAADKEAFLATLAEQNLVNTVEVETGTVKLIQEFIRLLQHDYFDTTIELTTGGANISHTKSTTYNKTGEVDNNVDLSNLKSGDKTRYVVDDTVQITEPKIVPWHGIDSVVAKVNTLNANARLGSETILIGKGEGDNPQTYVLFVDNSHKATGFFELPGGGLHNISQINDAGFDWIAKQRLYFKGGLDTTNHIKDFAATGKALVLQEKGVAKDAGVVWPWSYYKLYQAFYSEPIADADIDYNFDNKKTPKEIMAKGEKGYICTLRWVPIESLDLNRSIKERYSNIIPLIKSIASKY